MADQPCNVGAISHGGTIHIGRDAVGVQHNHRPDPELRHGRSPNTGERADVGILTVLTEELRAVVGVLERHRDFRHGPIAGGTEVYTANLPADGGNLRVVAVQTLDRGNRSAAVAFDQLRQAFAPPIVLLVGIAGGIHPDLTIGDVVIAEDVIYYDARRETSEGPHRRGQSQPTAPALRRRLNEFFRIHGHTVGQETADPVRVRRGPIGTGDAVITDGDSEILRWLRDFNEKVLAVETEAGGVGQAFYEHVDVEPINADRSLQGWLTIRGISDLADHRKGHDRHQFAADRAAKVMDHLLPLLQVPDNDD